MDGRRKSDCFMNGWGVVQSLALLICCAVGVVESGVILSVFVLIEIHFSLIALFLLPPCVLTVALFVVLMMYPPHHLVTVTVQKLLLTSCSSVHHQCDFRQRSNIHRQFEPINQIAMSEGCAQIIISMLLLRSGDVELNPGPGRSGNAQSEHGEPEQETHQHDEDFPRGGAADEVGIKELQQEQERFAELQGPGSDDGIQTADEGENS